MFHFGIDGRQIRFDDGEMMIIPPFLQFRKKRNGLDMYFVGSNNIKYGANVSVTKEAIEAGIATECLKKSLQGYFAEFEDKCAKYGCRVDVLRG